MPSGITPHLPACASRTFRGTRARKVLLVLAIVVLVSFFLTACGGSAPTAQSSARPTPTPTLAPTPTATPAPIPTPTPTPTPVPPPPPTQAPPPPPPPAPILDLRPSSMSFVGHLDCKNNGTDFICTAEVIADPGNQTTLNWFAFNNISTSISFSPAGGSLAPGRAVFVNIFIPVHVCNTGLFFFKGPANTHTITWAC